MTWLAGPQGGGWFAMAEGLSKLIGEENPDLAMSAVAGGGKENPELIQTGAGELAMSIDFLVAAAYQGREPYASSPMTKVNTIGIGWSPVPFHLLRARDAAADFKAAITGRNVRIAVPAKSTSDELTFRRVMAYYGTSYEQIEAVGGKVFHGTYDEIVGQLKNGGTDYLFGATTKPAAIIATAGEGPRPIILSDMPSDLIDHLSKTYGYGRGQIPSGTYPKMQSGPVSTTFMETVFVISSDVSEDAAFRITTTLLRNPAKLSAISASMADFNPRTAWRHVPVPLHPGAARAYKELGFMQ